MVIVCRQVTPAPVPILPAAADFCFQLSHPLCPFLFLLFCCEFTSAAAAAGLGRVVLVTGGGHSAVAELIATARRIILSLQSPLLLSMNCSSIRYPFIIEWRGQQQ